MIVLLFQPGFHEFFIKTALKFPPAHMGLRIARVVHFNARNNMYQPRGGSGQIQGRAAVNRANPFGSVHQIS